MRARPGLAAWLVLLWVGLWGMPSVANIVSGVAVVAVVLTLFPLPPPPERTVVLRPVAALRFAAWFAVKLVAASASVAWEVVRPGSRIRPAVVTVPVRGVSEALTTIVANSITLTPGTLTLEVRQDPDVLVVHVLRLRDADAIRTEVLDLERAVVAAFGSRAARAQVEEGSG